MAKKKRKVVRRPLKKKKPAKKRIVRKRVVRRVARKTKARRPKSAKKSAKKGVKKSAKKGVKKGVKIARKAKLKEEGVVVGKVTHYFPHVRAAVVKLKATLAAGDNIKIKGHTTDFTQAIDSIQIDRVPVNSAKKGAEIGLLVNSRVRQHDVVYKL